MIQMLKCPIGKEKLDMTRGLEAQKFGYKNSISQILGKNAQSFRPGPSPKGLRQALYVNRLSPLTIKVQAQSPKLEPTLYA